VLKSERELAPDAVLQDVLTSAFLKEVRETFGTPGDPQMALVSNPDNGIPWPEGYQPAMPDGYHVHRVAEGRVGGEDGPRLLGIRIDKLDLDQKESGLFREPVVVTLLNAGGTKDEVVIGGCSVYYSPRREGDRWVVECTRLCDP
jgi:hypothetical protein